MAELLLAAAAALPLIVAATLLVGALWPATRAMPVAWATAVVVGVVVWQLPIAWIAATTAWGVMLAVEILWIVFGALVLLYTLQQAGAIGRITAEFASISGDHRVQTVLVGFFLTTFLTGVAGFGTPAAIVAPLLVGLGFPALAAVVVALTGHAIATTFGAVGVPVQQGVTDSVASVDGVSAAEAAAFATDVSGLAGAYHLIPGMFVPLATVSTLVYFFGDTDSRSLARVMPVVPLALFAGVAFVVPFWLTAAFVGPEFPSIVAPLVGGGATVVVLKQGLLCPETEWRLPDDELWPDDWSSPSNAGVSTTSDGTSTMMTDGGESVSLARAWTPYLLLVVLLVGTRDFTPLGAFLTDVSLFTPTWSDMFGTTVSNSIDWAYAPGTWLVITALVAIPLYGLSAVDVKQAWRQAGETVAGPAVALVFVIGTVGILLQSGQYPDAPGGASMMVAFADGIGSVFDGLYVAVVAPIGALGTFVTGSVAVSNVTFSAMQYNLAGQFALNQAHVVAVQVAGGAMGNAISVHNVIAALATVGLVGNEGKVIRLNLVPVVAYTAILIVLLSVSSAIL